MQNTVDDGVALPTLRGALFSIRGRTDVVYVFFYVSGTLGPLSLNSTVPMREGAQVSIRPLEGDVSRLTKTLGDYPGAVIVAGNPWSLHFDLEAIQLAFSRLGGRVVNMVNALADRQEQAVADFMLNRSDPYIILASPEFEFSAFTESRRIDIDSKVGFGEAACCALIAHLCSIGEPATRPLSYDDMLRATATGHALRRANRMLSRMHASEDVDFQRILRAVRGER